MDKLTDFITPVYSSEQTEGDLKYDQITIEEIKRKPPQELADRFKALKANNKKVDDLWNNKTDIKEGDRSDRDFTLAKELKLNGFSLLETGIILWNYKYGKVREVKYPVREIVRNYERSGNDFIENAVDAAHQARIDGQVNPITVTKQERKEKMSKKYGVWGIDAEYKTSSVPIFKHLLDRETVALVYGPSNSGKSFLMLDAAVHLALGKDWAGYKCKEKMAAIVIATEAGKAFGKRVVAARRRAGVPKDATIEDFPFIYYPVRVDFLNNKDDLLLVRQWIKEVERDTGYKVGMVVVDTMAASFGGGNENSSEDAGKYVNNMIDLKHEFNVTPVIVHHSGKDESAGARGHSSLKGNVDTEIRVKSAKKGEKYLRSLTPTKQRDDETDQETRFGLVVNTLGKDADGDEITTCNVVFSGDKEFEDVTASPEDDLGENAIAALQAIKAYHRISSVKDINKWTEKQIKMILYFDILKENDEDRLFDINKMEDVSAFLKCRSPDAATVQSFDRACKELHEAEITKPKPKYQLISEGIDV